MRILLALNISLNSSPLIQTPGTCFNFYQTLKQIITVAKQYDEVIVCNNNYSVGDPALLYLPDAYPLADSHKDIPMDFRAAVRYTLTKKRALSAIRNNEHVSKLLLGRAEEIAVVGCAGYTDVIATCFSIADCGERVYSIGGCIADYTNDILAKTEDILKFHEMYRDKQ